MQFDNVNVDSLGHADDAGLINSAIETVATRVNSISRESTKIADVEIKKKRRPKLSNCEQGCVPRATTEQAKGVCQHEY